MDSTIAKISKIQHRTTEILGFCSEIMDSFVSNNLLSNPREQETMNFMLAFSS